MVYPTYPPWYAHPTTLGTHHHPAVSPRLMCAELSSG